MNHAVGANLMDAQAGRTQSAVKLAGHEGLPLRNQGQAESALPWERRHPGAHVAGTPKAVPALPGSTFHSGLQAAARGLDRGSLLLGGLAGLGLGLLCLISPWVGLVAVLGIAFLLVVLQKPVALGYPLIAATTLLAGLERGRLIPLFSANEAVLLLSAAVAFFLVLAGRLRQPRLGRYFAGAFALLIGGVVVIPIAVYLLQGVELNLSNGFKLVGPFQYFLVLWLFTTLPQGEGDRRALIRWLLVCGAIVAAVGLLQALRVGFVINLLESWYPSAQETMAATAGRVTSLLGAWNALGIFLTFTFLIGWAVLSETETPADRILTIVSMALVAVCLVASGSYSSLGSLVMGVLLIQILAPRKLQALPILIVSAAAVGIAIVALLPIIRPMIDTRLAYQYRLGGAVPQTLDFRFQVWREVFLPPILEHLPWAVAPTVPGYFSWQFEENQYILLLFRTGLVGLVGYLGWVGLTLAWLLRRLRQSSGFTKAMVAAPIALVTVVTVAGLTNEVFSFSGSAEYLWIMLAFVANSQERPL